MRMIMDAVGADIGSQSSHSRLALWDGRRRTGIGGTSVEGQLWRQPRGFFLRLARCFFVSVPPKQPLENLL